MLAALAESGHEFQAWVPNAWRNEAWPGNGRLTLRPVRAGGFAKLTVDTLEIPRALRQWPADRLFSLGDTGVPRSAVPQLLLVQQAYLAYAPEEWGFPVPMRFRAKLALMRTYFRLGLPAVAHFSVQSQHMKARLSEHWRIPTERIAVIASGLDLSDVEAVEKARPPYVCCVATAAPHKNLNVLPGMMAALAPQHRHLRCKLTVSMQEAPRLAALALKAGVLDRMDFLGGLSRHDTVALMSAAAVSLVPSLLESFGMTYYESMSLGTPVVAADVACAREACGDAALYAEPHSPESFAAQVERALCQPSVAADLVAAGRARAQKLPSWPEVAQRHITLLESDL